MEITQKLLSLGKMARGDVNNTSNPLFFTKPLQRIIIHWIGPYPNQAVSTPWNHWENGNGGKGIQASAHFIIKDADIIQCVPLDEVAWHSGDARNYDSIGIEVIPKNAQGEFSKYSIEALKLLIQHIRKETGKQLPIERHYDGIQKKDCPRYYQPRMDLVGVDGRVENPDGGQERWETLKLFLNS
jgi:N-acetylmuramoyl-L-alanine amidase